MELLPQIYKKISPIVLKKFMSKGWGDIEKALIIYIDRHDFIDIM